MLRGTVAVDGTVARKPAQLVAANSVITVADAGQAYVSRAALKLKHGLAHFGLSPAGKAVLDLGASTGGFTQVLLEQGAHRVTALDVGHGQLHRSLAADPRVDVIEGLNARDLTAAHLHHPVEMIVSDVSFISLTLALPPALALAEPGAPLVALVKPQFEVGRAAVGRGGLVAAAADQARAVAAIEMFLAASGWQVLGVVPSPIHGGDGNVEFLLAARKP